MDSDGDCKALLDSISASLVSVTRTANRLAAEDFDFHRSLNPELGTTLDKQNARLLGLSQRLLGNAAAGTKAVRPRLTDADSIDDNWRSIVDVLDSLLEKADTSLDEFTGAVKRQSPAREQTPTGTPRTSRVSAAIKSNEIAKPQLTFQHPPTNTEAAPFHPLLQAKPHAAVPLAASLTESIGEDGHSRIAHPYAAELEAYEYPSYVYTRAEPIPYQPFESTTAVMVDTEESLEEMLEELKQAKEIAIDLEHHDYRSYIGIVSLMQISTRNKDWIVDTLKPWRRKLSILNEVFADPNILKVLHGAHMDTIWLQRDLGLYLVGLFDTHHASRVLGYPGGSLAFLLKKFIDFDAQKQYQTADWRIRPLPQELFDYARSDTHFLLYIYDHMRNELIDRSSFELPNQEGDKLFDVLKRSKETASQVYNHPVYDAVRGLGGSGWYKLLSKTNPLFTKEQFSVFRALHQWRDTVAREQDDSTHYVLSNHHLFNLAKEMPTEKPQLFSIVQPMPQTVKLRADELLDVVSKAKDAAQNDVKEMREVMSEIDAFVYGEPAPATVADAAAVKTGDTEQALPTNSAAPLPLPTTTLSALKAAVSLFWGPKLNRNERRPMSTLAPKMVIPLPDIKDAPFIMPGTPGGAARDADVATPTPQAQSTPATSEKDDIFTLRALSNKRKADELQAPDEAADALATNNDEVSLGGDDHAARRAAKAALKAEKKAAKKARKSEVDDEPAFDYASAPSVYKTAPMSREDAKKKDKPKREKKEPFSFAKGLSDVQRGLGRKQKDGGGRSMTFKQ